MPALRRVAVGGGDLVLRRSGAHSEDGVGVHPSHSDRGSGRHPSRCGSWPWRIGRFTPMSRSSPPSATSRRSSRSATCSRAGWRRSTRSHLPKLGVYGNHDDEPYMTWFGIDDVHVNRIDLDNGISFSGFEGCVSYRRSGHGEGRAVLHPAPGQEADPQAAGRRHPALPLPAARRQRRPRRSRPHRLRGAAQLGARAPPALAAARPRPPVARASCCSRIGDTRVVYVNGARVIDLS